MYIYAYIHRRRQQWAYQTCDLLPISCALYPRCIRYVHVSHISFMWVTGLVHMYVTTHSYVGHDSKGIHAMTHSCVWHDSFIRVTGLIYMCDRTHTCVWHDSFICVWHDLFVCVTWLIHMCVTWLIHMCVTWLICMCNMTHSYVCNTCSDTATHVLTLQHMFWHCNTCSYVLTL